MRGKGPFWGAASFGEATPGATGAEQSLGRGNGVSSWDPPRSSLRSWLLVLHPCSAAERRGCWESRGWGPTVGLARGLIVPWDTDTALAQGPWHGTPSPERAIAEHLG